MDRYGDWRVIRQHAQGNVLRVWVEHVTTGERRFITIPVGN